MWEWTCLHVHHYCDQGFDHDSDSSRPFLPQKRWAPRTHRTLLPGKPLCKCRHGNGFRTYRKGPYPHSRLRLFSLGCRQ